MPMLHQELADLMVEMRVQREKMRKQGLAGRRGDQVGIMPLK